MDFRIKPITIALTLIFGVIPPPKSNFPVPFALAQVQNDRKAEADRLLEQAGKQSQAGKLEEALQISEQVLSIYRSINDRLGEGKTLKTIGNIHETQKNYDRAIEY